MTKDPELTMWHWRPHRTSMISRKVCALGALCLSSMATTQNSQTVIVPVPVPYLCKLGVRVVGKVGDEGLGFRVSQGGSGGPWLAMVGMVVKI